MLQRLLGFSQTSKSLFDTPFEPSQESATAFFVLPATRTVQYSTNKDKMLIVMQFGLPTIFLTPLKSVVVLISREARPKPMDIENQFNIDSTGTTS
jgi:hypothetical protein